MKCTVFFVLLVTCLAHQAQSLSIQDIIARIPQEEQFLTSEISSTRSTIKTNISNKRSSLNNYAESIKSEMRNGPSSCTIWIGQIESIQQGFINFPYYFQACEKGSELVSLENTKASLREMQRTAEKVSALCALPGYNCQQSINDLSTGLDAIHNDIARKIGDINAGSKNCIESKGKESLDKLDGDYGYWKNCSKNNSM